MEDRASSAERWGLFFFAVQCGAVVFGLLSYFLHIKPAERFFTGALGLSAFGFVVLHGVSAVGGRRLAGFLTMAAALGFLAEVFSLHYGSLFGCSYVYPVSRWHDLVLGVPVSVAVFWGVFIYGGYSVVNGFLHFVGADKPQRRGAMGLPHVLLLALADAFVVTAIDVYMDPITTLRGSWIWAVPGPFFGVPIGNFAGWFAVAFVASLLFRTHEFLRPRPVLLRSARMYVLPGLSYLLLAVIFTVYTYSVQRLDIALSGLFAMAPVAVLSLACYLFGRRSSWPSTALGTTGKGASLFH